MANGVLGFLAMAAQLPFDSVRRESNIEFTVFKNTFRIELQFKIFSFCFYHGVGFGVLPWK